MTPRGGAILDADGQYTNVGKKGLVPNIAPADDDRRALYDSMQTGIVRDGIVARHSERMRIAALSPRDQLRIQMVREKRFDIAAVEDLALDVHEEHVHFKTTSKAVEKANSRGFWRAMILSSLGFLSGGWFHFRFFY
jgi:hypothetical protein